MKKQKVNLLIVLLVSMLFGISNIKAAAISFYANKTSAYIGDTIVITAKTNDALGSYSITSSNAGVLSPVGKTSGDFPYLGQSTTYQFKANAVGSATITLRPTDMALYSTTTAYTSTSSITINVKAKPVIVLSGDNGLASLGVEGKEISPSFNRDTLEYSVELEPETTNINILTTPSHGGASINGAGNREVVDGENRLEIVVTAENGSSRTYILNASVKEYNPIKQTVDGKEYTVVRKRSLLEAPENYKETTATISDEEVPAYYSEVTKCTLVGLKNENGNINLYVYKDNTYRLYNEYNFNKIILYPLEMSESDIPNGYKKTTIIYNDSELIAYKIDDVSDFAIIYGMNIETGEKHIYMYNEEEDTLQIYNDERIKIIEKENDDLKLLVAILSGVSVFLLFICIIVGSKKIKVNNILDSNDDIKVTEIKGTNLSKREEKKLIKVEQQRKLEEEKKYKREYKKKLKEDARKLKKELKLEKKLNKKNKEEDIDIRNI